MNAIQSVESGGDTNCEHRIGDAGHSHGCFQIQTTTFNLWSEEHLGYVATQTYWTQRYVVTKQVQKWIAQGYTDRGVALMYNHPASQGKTCGEGYNKKIGVKWNSCAYAQSVLAKLSINTALAAE